MNHDFSLSCTCAGLPLEGCVASISCGYVEAVISSSARGFFFSVVEAIFVSWNSSTLVCSGTAISVEVPVPEPVVPGQDDLGQGRYAAPHLAFSCASLPRHAAENSALVPWRLALLLPECHRDLTHPKRKE